MLKDDLIYHEKHSLPKWTWFIMVPLVLLFWGIAFVQVGLGIEVGNRPMSDGGTIAMAIIFGLLFPVMFLLMRGEVKVTREAIMITFSPLYRKRIELSSIKKIEKVGLKPLREFGGWGIRWNGMKWGFILDGDGGVEITSPPNKIYVISSRHAGELYKILEENLKRDRS